MSELVGEEMAEMRQVINEQATMIREQRFECDRLLKNGAKQTAEIERLKTLCCELDEDEQRTIENVDIAKVLEVGRLRDAVVTAAQAVEKACQDYLQSTTQHNLHEREARIIEMERAVRALNAQALDAREDKTGTDDE